MVFAVGDFFVWAVLRAANCRPLRGYECVLAAEAPLSGRSFLGPAAAAGLRSSVPVLCTLLEPDWGLWSGSGPAAKCKRRRGGLPGEVVLGAEGGGNDCNCCCFLSAASSAINCAWVLASSCRSNTSQLINNYDTNLIQTSMYQLLHCSKLCQPLLHQHGCGALLLQSRHQATLLVQSLHHLRHTARWVSVQEKEKKEANKLTSISCCLCISATLASSLSFSTAALRSIALTRTCSLRNSLS